ncbi:MAG: spore coat biosynthesis protein F [Blastomonas fulva]|jgi:CTP:molybdopterin cytidylyltransferase MocA|uniref:spore coat biosynthesis protein F n=1 Tax=Blastomonas fulva TaxID=1550728 RepID=UPI0040334E8B
MSSPTVLILAGKRDGKLDPLAEAAGVTHKCNVPIQGKPLLQWVLEGVKDGWADAPIWVSIHDPEVIADVPGVAELTRAGRLNMSVSRDGIVESIEAVIEQAKKQGTNPFPMLITTGDNVLVTAEEIRAIHDFGMREGAGAVIAIAEKASILAEHPEAQRRFYEFKDMAISNCNAYWLRDAASFRAAEAFRGGGQFIKTKGRIAQAFGILNLIRFRLGWSTVDGAMAAISRRFKVKVRAFLLTEGAYAVDVDNERTYKIAEMLLAKRKPS